MRACRRVADPPRLCAPISATSRRVLSSAGYTPKISVDRIAVADAKTSTGVSSRSVVSHGTFCRGIHTVSARIPA